MRYSLRGSVAATNNSRQSTLELLPQEPEAEIAASKGLEPAEERTATEDSGQESLLSAGLQIFFPFILAGVGMVTAGIVLDKVAEWDVFINVAELFILVPALLGLKGNLEMTLASRLSTHASLGTLDTMSTGCPLIVGNLALIQCQGIVVGTLSSIVATLMSYIAGDQVSYESFVLLCSSSIMTASIASFVLALLMVGVVIASRKVGCNPDNVAAPIAASLGDLTTLSLLAWVAEMMYDLEGSWVDQVVILVYVLVVAPVCAFIASRNEHAREVLTTGWTPILCSMCISSAGGLILDHAVERFPRMAAFQPVVNGAGGNLVAVQASRIATHLHNQSRPGDLKDDDDSRRSWIPCMLFSGPSVHVRSARVLMCLVIPGQLVFFFLIKLTAGDDLGFLFLGLYLLGTLLQEWVLLFTCTHVVHKQWSVGIDPDSAAVPYLTALGDLCGTALLTGMFVTMEAVSAKDGHKAASL